ncbi:unnamed protein product [Polarella glacialis]|uniref:Uncharacterized protein n=1 Tax=Polarella glacialis TaxID=89957 RepID=A0A813FF61_POLGL|nr:unnamed protein product [Polarella glacialis]
MRSLLRAQCAAGPGVAQMAQVLQEVLLSHSLARNHRLPLTPEDLDAAMARGYWSLAADESGMHLREREAERLLERARRDLWAPGSTSRKELEAQISHFLCWHLLGCAANRACLRFSFVRASSSPSSEEVLRRLRYARAPGSPGIWWRLELAPLELPLP